MLQSADLTILDASAVRTVGRVATSCAGQSIIRTVFGTLFGGTKR